MPDVEAYLELDLDDPRAWESPQSRGQFTTGWDLHRVQTALIDNTVTGITYALATRTLWLERAARPEATATSEDLERWDAELARAVEALDVTPEARPMWLWCAERYY